MADRTCTKCAVAKPVSCFLKDKRLKSGLWSICKECNYARIRERAKLLLSTEQTSTGEQSCHVCHTVKPRDAFYKDASRSSGRSSRCKDCQNKRDWSDSRERYLAEYAYRAKASLMLRTAVKRKEIEKWPTCAMPDCGNTNVQGHHPDYSRPLDVVWLCTTHHAQLHREAILAAAGGSEK